ncbi:MAG TPA: alpha/beta fold hydrolase [Dongiaceae bacterium]|nr:alpha/beta fold hydrolase [Dongiaceae bacterium]
MKIQCGFRTSVLGAFVWVWVVAASGQQVPQAIATDPPADKEFPAAMEAPDVSSHGARLNAVMYLASGVGPHPAVLLLHGFPGNEKNLDLAYAIRRAGWNVLIPHYRGSWGSEGEFSFTHAIEDTQAALDFLRNQANAKKYRTDPARIVLIGHSMGGFLALYTAARNSEVGGVAAIAAWNLGPSSLRAPSTTFKSASPRLAGSTAEGLRKEANDHSVEWNYVGYAEALKSRALLVLEAKDGNTGDNQALAEAARKAGGTHVTEILADTDHVFSDHRIALQAAVLTWLESMPAPSAK